MTPNQFDRYALDYSKNRAVQDEVADMLLSMLKPEQYSKIIDIGCGDGAIFERIWQNKEGLFVGVDASVKMCELHQARGNCSVINADFDAPDFADMTLERFGRFELLISSSALQWSSDLSNTIISLSRLSDEFAISMFTDGAFCSFYDFLGLKSFLPSVDMALFALRAFRVREVKRYKSVKNFENAKEATKYMKRTGVSRGLNALDYRKVKELYEKGPSQLEFEAACIVGSF